MKPVKETKADTNPCANSTPVTRSSSARANIVEGTRLYARPDAQTRLEFIKVYGPNGPKMTWAQRAEAGVDAKHFQGRFKAKGPRVRRTSEALGPKTAEGLILYHADS